MFNRRSTLSDIEDAGEYAMKQVLSAANSVGKSAKQVSNQIEDWANDGYDAVRGAAKSDAAFWGAITVGMGACVGGLFSLWRFAAKDPRGKRMVRDGKRIVRSVSRSVNRSGKRVARAVAAANRDMNRFIRSVPLGMPGAAKPTRKRSRKTTRPRRRKTAA
jgi:hypothetical protein